MFKLGRQNTGYLVLTLFKSKLLKKDAYLIKYPKGSYSPPHLDPCPEGYVHKRLNIVCFFNTEGGLFMSTPYSIEDVKSKSSPWDLHPPVLQTGFLSVYYFNPSEIVHRVTTVTKGTRWVLSFGWLKKNS